MSGRDLQRERRFLVDGARGHDRFVEQARQRLEAGQAEYGDRWCEVGVRELLGELLEEATDLGAWAVLVEQALDCEPGLTAGQCVQVRAVLGLVARRGAQAHAALSRALASLPVEAGRDA